MTVKLHPRIDGGIHKGSGDFAGGTLTCACVEAPVKVRIEGDVAHNHACGCTKCWKPDGATFSIVAVVPHDKVHVVANGNKLRVVDPSALIQRHACTQCGIHLYGPVERHHPFQGLDFIHPERFEESGWSEPTFAAFVSSIIESGVDPAAMGGVRSDLRGKGLEPYDCLSPALMDYMATWAVAQRGASTA